ncbi:protein phosphatase 1, regulatory (inhibitor) subunit 14Ab [Hemitrygon akajei]|uniref:protein phosphatase 1, regulatory (inhibitor) subunit 14Ab n=1 Tax=Hypanus sabinus TaxID=79690 RepID=UPI0028C4427E|nr:protein phosphatase 1, regulatory (inhibitor) subunit 14Ab [Hypanus sabinus]
MAAERVGRKGHSPREPGVALQRRQARVTARYDRSELQRRLDVERWMEDRVRELYGEQADKMPEEVNIDDLLELQSDEERGNYLQIMFTSCGQNTDEFIRELVAKLQGLHKVQVQRGGQEEGKHH